MTKEEYLRDPDSIVPICYDEMFRAVFGNEKYPNITAYLISLLTGIPYLDIKGHIVFKNTKNNINRVKAKKSDKDVVFIVDLEESLKINLEMNYSYNLKSEIIDRNIYYLSNYHGMGLEETKAYDEIVTTIQYNFNLDYVDYKNKKPIDEYKLRNEYGNILSEKFKIVHINIVELSEIWYSEDREKYPHSVQVLSGLAVVMLCDSKKEFDKSIREIPLEEEIREDIERIVEEMNLEDQIPERYYNREEELARIDQGIINGEKKRARAAGLREGREEGREEGRKEERKEIAQAMLAKKMNIETISEITGLTVDEIETLR